MNTDTQKKKVLIVITKDDVGGAQKYVADLSIHLNPQKFSATVLRGGQELKWLTNRIYPWLFFVNDWLAIFELVRTFKKERPDIIHLNSSKTGVLGGLAAAIYKFTNSSTYQPKIVFTAHGWVFNPTNRLSRTEKFFYRMLHRISALFQDFIINVSSYDYELALRYRIAPLRKLFIIPNGIDYKNLHFLDKVSARKEILKKLTTYNLSRFAGSRLPYQKINEAAGQLTTDKIWVGSIGRLVKEKDYATLVRAATEIPNACFFIIGDGYEKEKLKLQITDCQLQNRFFIIEPTGADAKYLKAFDIFALSSIKEGLPYTLLEAMGAGLPIVATAVGGIPEAIHNKETGIIIPPRNPAEFRAAVTLLASDRETARSIGRAAEKYAHAHFTLARMTEETMRIYNKLLENL